jgi:hypothetical protein
MPISSGGRVLSLFARRLWLPVALFVLFNLGSVGVYMALEPVSFVDALFWIIHPHALHLEKITTAAKLFALVVYTGVFFFQVWLAERVLVTIFAQGGVGAWERMMNQLNVSGVKDHFVCAATARWAERWSISS